LVYQLADLMAKAKGNGGECLSEGYYGALSNHRWKCGSCDLEWKATWSSINNRGSWCPNCRANQGGVNARKYTISDLKIHARSKKGNLLSTEYTVSNRKYEWRCEQGHRWNAKWEKIRVGQWCPECSRENTRKASLKTLSDVQEAASKFGGKCLSRKYEGVFKELEFKCENGHVFYRQPASIFKSNPSQQVWCPHCKGNNLSENICRAAFEVAYGKAFPNKYPSSWLVNSRGNKMQLDGYCAELNLAFEYHGEQHYKDIGRFPGHDLSQRQQDDETKKNLCLNHGITLVVIPFFNLKLLKSGDVVEYLSRQCRRHGVSLPEINKERLDEKFHYYSSGKLNELKKLANDRGGELLSNVYQGMNYTLKWKCFKCEHIWMQTPNPIYYQECWCPKCAGTLKQTIIQMRDLAKSKGGECLSKEYTNSKSHLHWKCGTCSYDWYATPDNVKAGTWCGKCVQQQVKNKSKANFLEVLASKSAVFEGEYTDTRTKLVIRCHRNHLWRASPGAILHHGSWCPSCNREETTSSFQNKIRDIVLGWNAKYEGVYVGSNSVFSITCKNRHTWNVTAVSLLKGQWCKECKKEQQRELFSSKLELFLSSKGGQLKSEYINAKTKVHIKCREGHCWEVTPDSVYGGTWCPACSRERQAITRPSGRGV